MSLSRPRAESPPRRRPGLRSTVPVVPAIQPSRRRHRSTDSRHSGAIADLRIDRRVEPWIAGQPMKVPIRRHVDADGGEAATLVSPICWSRRVGCP